MNPHQWRRILSLLALALLVLNGVATLARAATWSTTDLRSGVALPSGTVTVNHVTVAWQVGNYMSDGLRIYGLLCTPTSLRGPHPVAILNHGLTSVPTGIPFQFYFPAIEAYGWIGCANMAANGWLTAITTYRGEIIGAATNSGFPAPYTNFVATSDGWLELCLGEVDDVLNLLSAVTALPNANANQVLMWGHSLGSCVTERAVERGAPIQIAVSLDGPTDFTTWTNNNPILAPTVAAQDARSSAWSGNDPGKLAKVKFLRIQAEGDVTVTPDQACELASKLPGSANYYLYSAVSPPGVYWGSPKECAAFSMPWRKGQLLPDEVAGGQWASPTLLMYSGLNHSTIRGKAWPEFRSFVNAVANSGGWPASIPSQYSPFEN
jgi:Prolyl oligopeptidase family